jgi:hypothetical protein
MNKDNKNDLKYPCLPELPKTIDKAKLASLGESIFWKFCKID